MGPKDAPCEHPSPAKTSAPAPSAFIFPPRRSHFPRMAFGLPSNDVRPCRAVVRASPAWPSAAPPQSNRHPAAAVIHNGLSTEKLSTSLLAALCKTFSPSRLRTRIIIYRSPVGRSWGVSAPLRKRVRAVVAPCSAPPCAGWGRAKAKADAPSRSAEHAACVPNHCAQRRKCTRQSPPLPVRSPRGSLSTAVPPPADGRSAERRVGEGEGKGGRPLAQQPALSPPTVPYLPAYGRAPSRSAPPPPPKWAPRLRRREGKRPNGAPPHRTAHTPNAERKRYLHNSRTKTQRRTKRCAQFVFFVFTPCKLLHNFSTVLHRSPRNVPKRAQMAARRPDFPCFTARFSNVLPESHRAKHPRTGPVLPPKNAPLRAYAKPRPHSRVRGTRQHATTCAFFTFSTRYEQGGGARNANFCPAEGRKWGRFRSQMLKNGPQTKKSTFSFGRLVI